MRDVDKPELAAEGRRETTGRHKRWPDVETIPVGLALVWIATRSEYWMDKALRGNDRAALFQKLEKSESTWIRPTVEGMTCTLADASFQLDFALGGLLRATGDDPNGRSTEVPDALGPCHFFIDEVEDRIIELTGKIIYLKAKVEKTVLIHLWNDRDTFAARHFQKPVWNAKMTAYWIKKRSSRGYYDHSGPSIDYEGLHEALQIGCIPAVVDGVVTDRHYWFTSKITDACQARFDQTQVTLAFPANENPNLEGDLMNLLSLLPVGTARSHARKLVKRRYDIGDAMLNRLLEGCPHLVSRPRGRPPGSKNTKGR